MGRVKYDKVKGVICEGQRREVGDLVWINDNRAAADCTGSAYVDRNSLSPVVDEQRSRVFSVKPERARGTANVKHWR